MKAKFSLIYAKCGQWDEAAKLLVEVRESVQELLRPEHRRSRQVSLFLSDMFWNQGKAVEAADLQSAVLSTCISFFGPHHIEILRMMDRFGLTRWQQGQYSAVQHL
jgi:hypothetical protein